MQGPVVSVYLDVDGQRYIRPKDYEVHLDQLLRRARERAMERVPAGSGARNGTELSRSGVGDAEEDLRRIEGRVKAGIDRSHTRGVAVFSAAADNWFEFIELTVPVRNHLSINQTPHVRQLDALLERYRRYGVLLVDRQRARVLVFQAAQLSDRSELFDLLPRHDDDRGDWDRDHVRDHADAAARAHVRRAAHVAFDLHQQKPLEHVILAGPETVLHDVERELHSYLRERIVARLRLPTTAPEDEIRAATAQVEEEVEKGRTDQLVNQLRDAIGATAGHGVAGLDPVLKAIIEHRVQTLLVSDDFESPGWRCRSCDYLATMGPSCPLCSIRMDLVDDVVEEAIGDAVNQSVKVVQCIGNADLDCMGRIGALLRF